MITLLLIAATPIVTGLVLGTGIAWIFSPPRVGPAMGRGLSAGGQRARAAGKLITLNPGLCS